MRHFERTETLFNIFEDGLKIASLWLGLIFLLWLSATFVGVNSTELTCYRYAKGTECVLLESSLYIKHSPIEIHNPIAVDVEDDLNRYVFGGDEGLNIPYSSSALVRVKDSPSKIEVYSGADKEKVMSVASDINKFLLSPQVGSFHQTF